MEPLYEMLDGGERSLELGASQGTRTDLTSFEIIIERDLDKKVVLSQSDSPMLSSSVVLNQQSVPS